MPKEHASASGTSNARSVESRPSQTPRMRIGQAIKKTAGAIGESARQFAEDFKKDWNAHVRGHIGE